MKIDFETRKRKDHLDKRRSMVFEDNAEGDFQLAFHTIEICPSNYTDLPFRFIEEKGLREEFQGYLENFTEEIQSFRQEEVGDF